MGERAFDLIEPGRVLGGEVPGPARVVFEPVEHVVGVVIGQVVADEVAAAVGVRLVDAVEELYEGVTAPFFRRESEELSVASAAPLS